MIYQARGRTVATSATADHAVAVLWNPHSTIALYVKEWSYVAATAPGAASGIYIRRTTTRGTAGSTVTPGAAQSFRRLATPESGALLDLAAFSAQPTFSTGAMFGWLFAAVAASGIIYPVPEGIEVPPGAGLAIVTNAAIIVPAGDVSFKWEE